MSREKGQRRYRECPVCQRDYENNAHGSKLICDLCYRSLLNGGSTNYDIIAWAARRAIRFERKRQGFAP